MDVAMPVMNGLEATRRLKRWPDAPTIFLMTGQDDTAYADAARAAGADTFLAKSVLAEELPALLLPLLAD
jgi:CheY-like chemotaxis protein